MKKVVFILAMVMVVSAINAQTRTSIKLSDLPKAITENISTAHQGWIAQEAFKIDTKNVLTYEVVVKKASSEMNFIYDKDGKYLKMEPRPTASAAPTKSTAPTMHASSAKTTSGSARPKHNSVKK